MRQETRASEHHIYSAMYQIKARYQNLFQYEIEQKLSLMWEKDAGKMKNDAMLDPAITHRATITGMVPYGRRIAYTIQLFPNVNTNPHLDLGSDDQLHVWWSNNNDEPPSQVKLFRNKVPGRLCIDVSTNNIYRLQQIVTCWVGIKPNHVSLDRQFATIGNAVTAQQ